MKTFTTYTLIDEISASPTQPLAHNKRDYQLTRMWQGLHAMERLTNPTQDDWRVVSNAVNMMETLIEMGELADGDCLLHDAVTAMAEAGTRHATKGAPIRLSGPGMMAIRGLLEDYEEAMKALPARTMIRAHRKTERRVQEILRGKTLPGDVKVPRA